MKDKRIIKISNRGAFYLIEELPLPYMYAFLKKKGCTIVMFDDIPSHDEDDWGSSYKIKELQQFKKNVKKVCRNGTNLIIGQKDGDSAHLLEYSQRDIFIALDNGEAKIMQNVYAYFDTHDFDWKAHAYFESETCYNEFLNFVKKKYTVQS